MELGGTPLGTAYDHLCVLDAASQNGGPKIAYYNGFSPSYAAAEKPTSLRP